MRELYPEHERWGIDREMLATLVELQDEANRLQDEANRIAYSAATRGKRLREPLRRGRPLQVPRPATTATERRKATPREIARFFGATRRPA